MNWDTANLTFISPSPNNLIIYSQDLGNLVIINLIDGSMTFGENYKPDKAAQIFWSAMLTEYKDFLEWKKNK